jgi:hypothetical protein
VKRYSQDGKWILVGRYWKRISDGYLLPVIQGGGKAVGNQQAFRFRNDNEDEINATWMSPGNNVDQSIQIGLNNRFRVRFVVDESAGGTLNLVGSLFYSLDGGTYTSLTTGSSYIRAIDSNNDGWTIDDGDPTTQQIYTGTFVGGFFSDDGNCAAVSLDTNFTELEYCLYIFDATGSSTIDLRVYDTAAALDNYNQTPRITVQESVQPQTVSLNTLELNSNVQDVIVSPAATSQTLNTLEITSQIENVEISLPLSVSANTLILNSQIEDIAVVAGAVSQSLDTLILNSTIEDLLVSPGATFIVLYR